MTLCQICQKIICYHQFDHDRSGFAYKCNRNVDVAAVILLQFVVSSLKKAGAYIRMLFISYIDAVKVV